MWIAFALHTFLQQKCKYIDIFAEKMWVAFALQKLLTFLQQKYQLFENTLAKTLVEWAC